MIMNFCSFSLLSAMPGILRRKLAGLLIYNIFWHGWMKLRRRYFLLYKTITSRKMLYCLFQSCLFNSYSFRFWSPNDNKQANYADKNSWTFPGHWDLLYGFQICPSSLLPPYTPPPPRGPSSGPPLILPPPSSITLLPPPPQLQITQW